MKSNVVPSVFIEYLENMDVDEAKNSKNDEIVNLKVKIQELESKLKSKLKINKRKWAISRSKALRSQATVEKLKKIITDLSQKQLVNEKFADAIQV